MKIIGVAGAGFIVDASGDELANLIGYYYPGKNGCPRLEVGTVIRVAEMYRQLVELSRAHTYLDSVQHTLRSIADHVGLIDPLIPPIKTNPDEPAH